ncbi:MAG: toxic anion resistance protein [Clostridia bacterium]|nr:toxic anion resistance protein [Clostridia bacterium]
MTHDFPQLSAPILWEGGALEAEAVLPTLSAQDRAGVRGFAAGIDGLDPSAVAAYGAAEQGVMETWLDRAIKTVADHGVAQDKRGIDRILAALRGFDRLCGARRFLFGHTSFVRLRKEYGRLEPTVEINAGEVLDQKIGLLRVSKELERIETQNQAHLTRLSTYLLCGQVRLQELRASGTEQLVPFERRLHDIALSRQVALQTKAQLMLLLDGNGRLIDTMERTLRQTLPLWKSQVLVALGISAQAEQSRRVQRGHKQERGLLRQSNAGLLEAIAGLQKQMQVTSYELQVTRGKGVQS